MATTNNLTCQNGKNKTGKQNRKSIKNLSKDKLHTLECDSLSCISNIILDWTNYFHAFGKDPQETEAWQSRYKQ